MKRTAAGATLAGLLLALAIACLLAAAALPVWSQAVIAMRRAEAQAALQALMQQEERYYTQFNRYMAFSAASSDPAARQFRWWSGRQPASSAYEIEGRACAGQTIDSCIELLATPGTANVDAHFQDPQCARLTLTSTGLQQASGPGPRCWR